MSGPAPATRPATGPDATGIALIGTGFVADYYMTTLARHPNLRLIGAYDRDAARLTEFCRYWSATTYLSLEAALTDPAVAIIVNLTNPESHHAINMQALEAGKHVYCEKPLALKAEEAAAAVALAVERRLILAGAPANALSDAFHHTKTLIDQGAIGRPRLVYAEMEDGPVFRAPWQSWRSRSGARWPGVHEFELGCTLEHAGYATSWLYGLFGPIAHVSAFSTLAFPDKGPGTEDLRLGPDFSVGCLTHASGVVARLSCGLAAPRDRSLTILGETGTLIVRDLWDNRSAVHIEGGAAGRSLAYRLLARLEGELGRKLPFHWTAGRVIPYPKPAPAGKNTLPAYPSQIDFSRGIAVLAEAMHQGETPRIAGRTALHLTEVVLALNAGLRDMTPSQP
ncbi:Gfo/Idh/MocA family protein [Rhizobium sp. YIM 134829]|uniref:Gfo/Idh/MocA family protein n=1 Tax=Rhizobium sp. YIM 134829 TaxID=3390453 RepID=UPI003979B5BC